MKAFDCSSGYDQYLPFKLALMGCLKCLRCSVSISLSPQAHVVDGKMIIKVQYQNRKKYIKLQTLTCEEFISEGKYPD